MFATKSRLQNKCLQYPPQAVPPHDEKMYTEHQKMGKHIFNNMSVKN